MKIKMKCIIVLLGLLSLMGCKQKLSVEDISAENLFIKLRPSDEAYPNTDFGLFDFKPWIRFVEHPEFRYDDPNIKYSEQKLPESKKIEILDLNTSTMFGYWLKKGNQVNMISIEMPLLSNSELPFGKEAVDHLMKEEGYTYKATSHKNGHDILIKKIEDNFLVCSVFSNDQYITSLLFQICEPK